MEGRQSCGHRFGGLLDPDRTEHAAVYQASRRLCANGELRPYRRFLRTTVLTQEQGVWFVQIANNFGQNKEYSQEEREHFRHDKKAIVAHAKDVEDQVNGLWDLMFTGSEAQQKAQEIFRGRMAEFIKDKRLLDGNLSLLVLSYLPLTSPFTGFTPKWSIGCRRITPGDPYMEAIQKPNVDVHFTPVTKITEDGVIGADGVERKVGTGPPPHPP